jgi:hypothetical protein
VHEVKRVSRQGALDHGEGWCFSPILPDDLANGRTRSADARGKVQLHAGIHVAPHCFVEADQFAFSVFFWID